MPDELPKRLWAVALICFFERFTFWGLTAPWQNYMENARHGNTGAPGALGLGQSEATRIYCGFYVFYYMSTVAIAIVSDTLLGRYKTFCISAVLYVGGCVALVATSTGSALDHGYGLPGLIVAMALIGLGGGGFKMLAIPFIADQYDDWSPKIKKLKSGERVVTDYELTLQYIYNMLYWVGNVGSMSWVAATFLEQHVSFTVAYGVSGAAMILATAILFAGRSWYVRVPLQGNVIPTASKVLVCASKNGFRMARADPVYQRENRGKNVAWSSQFVDELTRGLRACRVLVAFVVYWVCFDQMQNNLISQAKQMETHGIPNDLLPAVNQVACIIIGPILQLGLYPYLTRRKISFRPIARITVGFIFVALSMLYATIVQYLIYNAPPCFDRPGECRGHLSMGKHHVANRVNVWVQTPVYVLLSTGEILASVTGLEYAYDHSPKDMRALVQAINLVVAGMGSAVAMGLTPIARNPDLIKLYGALCAAMTLTTVLFWLLFHNYDKHPSRTPGDSSLASDNGLEHDPDNDNTLTHHRTASVLRLRPRVMPSKEVMRSVQESQDDTNVLRKWRSVPQPQQEERMSRPRSWSASTPRPRAPITAPP